MNRKLFANAMFAASLAAAATVGHTDNTSPFPYTPDENGADQPFVPGGTYAELHAADTARSDGSSFPKVPDENGADQPEVPGGTYAELHHAENDHADGSSFPWVPDENDADMASPPPMSRYAAAQKKPSSETGD